MAGPNRTAGSHGRPARRRRQGGPCAAVRGGRAVLLACAFALAGCVLTVDDAVPPASARFDPRLLGTWQQVGSGDRVAVSRGEGDTYRIVYSTGNDRGLFEARLGRLGARHVLDVRPAPRDGEIPEVYAGAIVRGHVLIAITLAGDEVHTSTLDRDSLAAAIRTGRLRLSHRDEDDTLVLLDDSATLRAWLEPYLAAGAGLGDSEVWRRVPPMPDPVRVPCFEASPWPEADELFHRDPHWLGADVAASIDLGGDRTLWLFGDSFVDASGRGSRRGARMVSNTVAVQSGSNPATATLSFHWGRKPDGSPDALFPDRGTEALWFGHGVRIEDRLLLFFARTERTGTGIGFEHVGWTAVLIENPDDEPSAWRARALDTPANPTGILVGYAAVLLRADTVYAFGTQNPVKSHPLFVARWPAAKAREGDLRAPEWWAGERAGWVPDTSLVQRQPIFENARTELSIHLDPVTGRFLSVHSQGAFGPADIVMRAAPGLTGPWSLPNLLYRPSEYYRPGVLLYAAKAHPELAGADLVVTYASNTARAADLLADSTVYYPRFLRLARCR